MAMGIAYAEGSNISVRQAMELELDELQNHFRYFELRKKALDDLVAENKQST